MIDAWRDGEKRENVVNVDSGQESGRSVRSEVKRRSDVVIEGALERHLLITLMPRVSPEIEHVHAFDKEWTFEKFRVSCYDAKDAGFFRPHRDNPSEALSHRQVAASFNLNDGYEGGYLRFPEYGIDHYAPPPEGRRPDLFVRFAARSGADHGWTTLHIADVRQHAALSLPPPPNAYLNTSACRRGRVANGPAEFR